jgi:hypothetical protein
MISKMELKKMLWKRLKTLFANLFAEHFAAHKATQFEARQRLQKLRESELSVGAAMRRGLPFSRAPGQSSRSVKFSLESYQQASERKERRPTQMQSTSCGNDRDNENFALSFATSASSKSPAIGYVVGGSLTGVLVGAAASESATETTPDACSD